MFERKIKVKSDTNGDSNKRISCNKLRHGGFLGEGRGRLHIIRRCGVMLSAGVTKIA